MVRDCPPFVFLAMLALLRRTFVEKGSNRPGCHQAPVCNWLPVVLWIAVKHDAGSQEVQILAPATDG